ncbi:MAG: DUF4091 domain-containing protein [Victivallales bacterium]|nr:DUF4091 domain-containing protein [Victivallales bacterium]
MTKVHKFFLLFLAIFSCLLTASELQTRGRTVAYLTPDEAGRLVFDLTSVQIGRYPGILWYHLISLDGKDLIPLEEIALHQTKSFAMEKLPQGVYTLYYDAGQNAAKVTMKAGRFSVPATSEKPLKLIDTQPTVYFQIISEHEAASLTNVPTVIGKICGDYPAEHAALTLRDSAGQVVFQGDTTGKTKNRLEFSIPIPESEFGKVWSAEISKVPGIGFEDVQLQFDQGAEPTVAVAPEELTRPPYAITCTKIEDDDFSWLLTGQFACHDSEKYSISLYMSALNSMSMQLVGKAEGSCSYDNSDTPMGWCGLFTPLPDDNFYSGKFLLERFSLDDNSRIASLEVPVAVCQGKFFTEVPWVEKSESAPVTPEEEQRSFQVFQRAEPGDVRPTAFPHVDEITDRIAAEASPGMTTTEFFALYPLRNLSHNRIEIGPLVNAENCQIEPSGIELRQARMWPQRTDWNSDTYVVIPELLEEFTTVKLAAKSPALFCLQVAIPPDTAPGTYQAPILLNGKPFATYQLTVNDFTLPEVPNMTFGLYADGERWTRQNYTDAEILREMRDFRAHGMNALMLYPFTDGKIAYKDGQFDINLGRFRHEMQLYTQVGFPGVAVISFQHADSFLRHALGKDVRKDSPEYHAGFLALLETIRKMAEEDGWPHYCIHTVDEPDATHGAEDAVRTLRWVKEAGFETFNTCYVDFVRSHIGQWLDYRCYNNLAGMTSSSQKRNDEIRQESLDAGRHFWWYGTGCYTNGGLQQDGNIYSNRFMLGLFNWRTKATGAWTWTFLRVNENPYNDFDGNTAHEAKEACICYPAPQGNGLIPTLQWEALREGNYDYRYLAYWNSLCEQASPALAQQSRERIQVLMDAIPWTCLNRQVSNAQLRELRAALIQEIKALKEYR